MKCALPYRKKQRTTLVILCLCHCLQTLLLEQLYVYARARACMRACVWSDVCAHVRVRARARVRVRVRVYACVRVRARVRVGHSRQSLQL